MSALCAALTFHAPSGVGHADKSPDHHPPPGRTACRREIGLPHPAKHSPGQKPERNIFTSLWCSDCCDSMACDDQVVSQTYQTW